MNEHSLAIDRLLGNARQAALRVLEGRPATEANLSLLAAAIKHAIYAQVVHGAWRELGVEDWNQLGGIGVKCVLGNTLLGEPPIKIEYDFVKTSLPMVIVKSVRGS